MSFQLFELKSDAPNKKTQTTLTSEGHRKYTRHHVSVFIVHFHTECCPVLATQKM